MNFMKVEVLRFIVLNSIILFFLGCQPTIEVSLSEIVIKDCKVYRNNILFTGIVNHILKNNQLKKIKVFKGEIKEELIYSHTTLLSKKIFSECQTCEVKLFYSDGSLFQSGLILNGARYGEWIIYSKNGKKENSIFY